MYKMLTEISRVDQSSPLLLLGNQNRLVEFRRQEPTRQRIDQGVAMKTTERNLSAGLAAMQPADFFIRDLINSPSHK
jgi:hypothetical protein